ncbi:MAG TPA: CaiB/BaiF CoA-transferase family protein [Vicinamibacterales bacterium]|nr:CaiB/BaiF CoA-transferase family protein [Vicinamibacterales bacterium]
MPYPLTGVRVLDFTRLVPGAFATLMLAELGADVIKIEDPRGGDPMRHLPPLLDGRGVYDLLLNRGKKSVALDLRAPESAALLDRLVAQADVVVESFRPATARRLGVAGDQIRGRHPRVIHCAITGYGQTGPYVDRPGHDLNYVAISGVLSLDRPAPTTLPRMFLADIGGGAMNAVVGILAALYGRERSGEGTSIDISMHESALYWLMLPAARELVDGAHRATGELPTFGGHACYNVYQTKDGEWVALGALEPKFWQAFCRAIGRDDLLNRQLSEGGDQTAVIAEIRRTFASRTRDEWLKFFESHDVALTPVNRPAEALDDPHIAARGAVVRGTDLRAVRPPFARVVPTLSPAPALGQDTEDVLQACYNAQLGSARKERP